MTSKLITNSLKFILILMLISGLFGIVYSQNAKLTVPSDVRTDTLILNPQTPTFTPPCPCTADEEGRIFYNDNDNKLYYCDGTNWKLFNPEKTVATKIVSAYNSYGATRADGTACLGDGTDCSNPKADYTCDGTDDQHEINQAMNSLPANGGAVYLLEGTYNISATVFSPETINGIVPHSNTAIIGTGKGTVLEVVASANFNVINASSVTGILISQLMIDGNKAIVTEINNGIYFNAVTYSKIDKVWVENLGKYGFGIELVSSSNSNTITNNHLLSNGKTGLVAVAIYLEGSNNNIISGNNIQGNTGSGIATSGDYPVSNTIISNNNINGNTGVGITINNYCSNNTVTNNNVRSNNMGIQLSYGANNNIITSNNVQDHTSSLFGIGISVVGACNNIISQNNIQNNALGGIIIEGFGFGGFSCNNNTITNNVIYNNGYDGINLYDDSGNNIISYNRIYDSAGTGYGINISNANCAGNYLLGNLIDGLGYIDSAIPPTYDRRIKDLSISPNGTKYTDKAKLTFEQAPSQNPGAQGTINATSTYIPLNPTPASYTIANISDGKCGGDLLILEGINATNRVMIPNGANTRLHVPGSIPLCQNDTLSLIWDGNGTAGVGDWVEIGYSDN